MNWIKLVTNIAFVSLILIARKFAEETLDVQRSVFQRWGLMADWRNIYRTLDPHYITHQLHLFADLFEKGYIYQVSVEFNFE